jgi:hypothetical protein
LSLDAYHKSYAEILHSPNAADNADEFNNKTFTPPSQSDSNSSNEDNNGDDVEDKIKVPHANRTRKASKKENSEPSGGTIW